jgi:hypothetical protein
MAKPTKFNYDFFLATIINTQNSHTTQTHIHTYTDTDTNSIAVESKNMEDVTIKL